MEKKEFDQWLNELFEYDYLTECIPNKEMHEYLLNNIESYEDNVILNILRCLLHSYNRPIDEERADEFKEPGSADFLSNRKSPILKTEYYHRLINDYEAWEGLTWTVQLARIRPIDAVKALSLYLDAEVPYMPDFRIMGINQCIDIIEKKFIENCNEKASVLYKIRPREFEILIYNLYCAMGYNATLTPATRDGGKDVVATRKNETGIEKFYIECKLYHTTELTKNTVRAFGFEVLDNRAVNRGIMFATVKVNNYLKELHPRISVLEINDIIILLNSYLSYDWEKRIDKLIV